MNKSESIKNIGAALVVFHDNVGKIKKNASNPYFKSVYADLPNILDSIHEPLKASGLIFTQFPGDGLTTILIHPASGEWIESEYKIHPIKNDPQSIGSAITYARRYALGAILGLNIDTDDDGNAGSAPATNGSKNTTAETKPDLPWLNEGTALYTGAVKKLAAGKTDIGKIKAAFRISKTTETNLFREAKLVTNNN